MTTPGMKLCLNGCFKVKPVEEFGKHPRSPDGLTARCKPCELERSQRWRHGLTATEKAEIAAAQGGCAICHRPEPGKKGWIMDHDHTCCPGERSCTECRRGVICPWCNTMLGYATDSPAILRAAIAYLESSHRLDVDAIRLNKAVGLAIGPLIGVPTRRRTAPVVLRTKRRTNEEPTNLQESPRLP